MKIKLRIKTIDEAPENLRSLYRLMDGGGYILDHEPDPDGFGIDNLAQIRGKLEERNRDYDRVNQRLQGFKKADGSLYTAEELQALLSQVGDLTKAVDTLKDKSKTDEQKLADLVAQAKKPLETELAKFKASHETYRNKVHSAEKLQVVTKALEELKPLPEWREAIASEIARRVEIRERTDGTFEHVIMENGSPRMSSLMGRDGPMQIDEFAKAADFRQKFGKYLEGDKKKGADIVNPVERRGGNQPRNTGADVVIPKNANQTQFEAAFKKATEQGGEVVYAEEGAGTN